MNKKTSLCFMLVISFFILVLPTAIASVNEPENYTMNDFTPENGPYSIFLFGNLQGCYYPSLFHIGPIWFLPNGEYIDFTFESDPVLKVNGENYPVGREITIYGLKGFCPIDLGWTISSVFFNGNILAIGNCYSIES